MDNKKDPSFDEPFLLRLSQNLLYQSYMEFYAIRKGGVIEVHVGIMETRLGIFAEGDEAGLQFRTFFRIPEEIFAAGSGNRRNQSLGPQFFFNYIGNDICYFRSNDGRRSAVGDIFSYK